MQKLVKITQQTFWQIIVKLITSVSGFVILGIISYNFSESGTGDFTLALTYLGFAFVLVDFGFNAIVLQRLNKDNTESVRQELGKLLGLRISWSLLLMLLSLLIVLLLPSHFSSGFKLSVALGSIIILLYGINQTSQAVFQFYHRYDLDIFPTILGVVLGTLLIYFFGISHFPIYIFIVGYVVTWFIHGLLSYVLSAGLIKKYKLSIDFNYIGDLFKETLPFAATLILNTVYFRVDSFILSFSHSASEVGIYNMAYQFFQTILVLPAFIMNSFYPIMLATFKENIKKFNYQVKIAAFGLFLFSILITLITSIFSEFLIRLVTSIGFNGSITSLQILSLGLPAFFVSSLLLAVMVTKKMYKSLLITYVIGLTFNFIANLIFIPQYSYIAASWITGLSEYLILFLQLMLLWRR